MIINHWDPLGVGLHYLIRQSHFKQLSQARVDDQCVTADGPVISCWLSWCSPVKLTIRNGVGNPLEWNTNILRGTRILDILKRASKTKALQSKALEGPGHAGYITTIGASIHQEGRMLHDVEPGFHAEWGNPKWQLNIRKMMFKNWLVVDLPLWKMMEFVSWNDDIPNIWKVIKVMFQTTNQWCAIIIHHAINQPFGSHFTSSQIVPNHHVSLKLRNHRTLKWNLPQPCLIAVVQCLLDGLTEPSHQATGSS